LNLRVEGRHSPRHRRSALVTDRPHRADGTGRPTPLSPNCKTPPCPSPLGPGCTSRTTCQPNCLKTARWQICHTQALAYRVTLASSALGGHSWNSSRTHVTRTPASHPFTPSTFDGGSLPRNVATRSRHVEDSTQSVMGHPSINNPRIIVSSSRVTVISPHGKWKE
jgi:hypothetical protein